VTTAMYEVGYGSPSRLYEQSDSQLGMTPGAYRRGGRGMKISYTVSDCALGRVLVAATGRGISAVSLGDNDAQLVAELRKEYPQAEIRRGTSELYRWAREIVRRIAGLQPRLDLPTDVVATAFQRLWIAARALLHEDEPKVIR
jgi:AraC family transcriptional regulator of adaptative response/methylated-DNA-[protein]-cysteine methyltransferase